MIRSHRLHVDKAEHGRVLRTPSTKQCSMTLVMRTLRHSCFRKTAEGQPFGQIALQWLSS